MLHLLYPRASLARAAFTLKLSLIVSEEAISSRRRPPPPELKASGASACEVKSEKSESIFGPLIFFNLRYIKGGVRGNNNIGIKKCTTNFLWVLNFGEVGELIENFQKHPLGEGF